MTASDAQISVPRGLRRAVCAVLRAKKQIITAMAAVRAAAGFFTTLCTLGHEERERERGHKGNRRGRWARATTTARSLARARVRLERRHERGSDVCTNERADRRHRGGRAREKTEEGKKDETSERRQLRARRRRGRRGGAGERERLRERKRERERERKMDGTSECAHARDKEGRGENSRDSWKLRRLDERNLPRLRTNASRFRAIVRRSAINRLSAWATLFFPPSHSLSLSPSLGPPPASASLSRIYSPSRGSSLALSFSRSFR